MTDESVLLTLSDGTVYTIMITSYGSPLSSMLERATIVGVKVVSTKRIETSVEKEFKVVAW